MRQHRLMGRRDYGFRFDGEPVFTHVQRDAPLPPESRLEDDFFVYVMGPYTAFDATYAYSDADQLESPFIQDPLFDPEEHLTEDGRGSFESALADLCETFREELGVRSYLATDIEIPTDERADDEEPSMSVLDQSIAFSAVSDAVVFVFTRAGLTTGTGSEVGTILGEFHLREGNPEPVRKPRERFRVFKTGDFSSASIDEIPSTFGVDAIEFSNEDELITKTKHFLVNIERDDPDRPLPVFNPYTGANGD